MITAEEIADAPCILEPTAWMRTTARRRMIVLAKQVPTMVRRPQRTELRWEDDAPIVVDYLVAGHYKTGQRNDRSCDRCSAYCPPGSLYATTVYMDSYAGIKFLLVVGLCTTCGELEQPGSTPRLHTVNPQELSTQPTRKESS